jgi:hypothetical protein
MVLVIQESTNVISGIILVIYPLQNDNKSMQFKLIPSSFRDDKSIGDYIDELVYVSPEEMKFSHIPQMIKYEKWFEK